jgi:galactokinase
VSAPGRICLFGEHQDYLDLPVVACAISLRVGIEAVPNIALMAQIELPDVGARDTLPLLGTLPYRTPRDYLSSGINVLQRNGFTYSRGFTGLVRGNIPINTGTSSSSALVVAWVALLARLSDQQITLSQRECAQYAHAAEVLEFGEPGGMMDHLAASYGGIVSIDFSPEPGVTRHDVDLGMFVLGDSRESKDTTGILGRVKQGVVDAVALINRKIPGFTLRTAREDDVRAGGGDLTQGQIALLEGTLHNREITSAARALLETPAPDRERIGQLLTEHQRVLRDVLGISTPKIDRMIDAANNAGALGGKINGSGGGGCMFAYAPARTEEVAEAIARAGGSPFIVSAGEGVRIMTHVNA